MGNKCFSNNSTSTGTIDDGRALRSSVRNNDPSILPEPGEPFKIRHTTLSEKENIEVSDALLENKSVTSLELETVNYATSTAEAMAKYLRTSKSLQRIRWSDIPDARSLKQHEEMFFFSTCASREYVAQGTSH